MENAALKITMSSTSYPRSIDDWQGVFIRHIANALSKTNNNKISLWAPDGPRSNLVNYSCSKEDQSFLKRLSDAGGIAHLMKNKKSHALINGVALLSRLRRLYKANEDCDVFHINWLQNAIPLLGLNRKAVISVLGTDFKLLKLPGMVPLIRKILKTNQCILAPNANWMKADLERYFGDLCKIHPVFFGIDETWYKVQENQQLKPFKWLFIARITKDKLGPLFSWGEKIFSSGLHELHLVGPNPEGISIPNWVRYHGPASSLELAEKYIPQATGLVSLSKHSEGRPQIMLESMAAGFPIIASDMTAHTDFLKHQKTGLIVKNESEFLAALSWITKPENKEQLSSMSRQFARDNYGTWKDCANRYQVLYRELHS